MLAVIKFIYKSRVIDTRYQEPNESRFALIMGYIVT